jgi:hypothetical protein
VFPTRPEKARGNTRGEGKHAPGVLDVAQAQACFPPCCFTYLSKCLGVYRKSESLFCLDYLIDTCSRIGSNKPSLDTSSDFALVRLIRFCKWPARKVARLGARRSAATMFVHVRSNIYTFEQDCVQPHRRLNCITETLQSLAPHIPICLIRLGAKTCSGDRQRERPHERFLGGGSCLG